MKIQLLITGRGYDIVDTLPDELDLRDGSTLSEALAALAAALPDKRPLPPSALVSVSGEHVGTIASYEDRPLADGDELGIITPVAGG